LKVVLATALDKDPDRRYLTALDVVEDLRRIRCFGPIRVRPSSPILRMRRWVRQNPALALALAGIFVALASGLAVALHLVGRLSTSHDRSLALSDHARALVLVGALRRSVLCEVGRPLRSVLHLAIAS
jgi:serine/threonine-protein kinase